MHGKDGRDGYVHRGDCLPGQYLWYLCGIDYPLAPDAGVSVRRRGSGAVPDGNMTEKDDYHFTVRLAGRKLSKHLIAR